MRALTLGRTIFVPAPEYAELPGDRLHHELRHVQQWEQRGLLGFAFTYSYWQVVAGYDGNPLENFN